MSRGNLLLHLLKKLSRIEVLKFSKYEGEKLVYRNTLFLIFWSNLIMQKS